jgi:hypothetical protein
MNMRRVGLRLVLLFAGLGLAGRAQAQALPPPVSLQQAYGQPPYAQPIYPPPIYPPPPYLIAPPPFEVEQPGRRGRPVRPPFRALPWRMMLELGGSLPSGRAYPSLNGQPIATSDLTESARDLEFVFDLRLTLQRLFGEWFGLGLQLGYANWQAWYLERLRHPRSRYFSLVLTPEARIRLSASCRRCVSLIVGARLGALLSVPGEYGRSGWGVAQAQLGSGGVWGAQTGLEARLGERASVRLLAGYEGALLRNRVTYGARNSDLMSFHLERGLVTLGLVVGLL